VTSRCTFCTTSAEQVETLVAGPGVFICNECVDLSATLIATKQPGPRVPAWEEIDDQALLDHLPRIEAVRNQVDDDLRIWVTEAPVRLGTLAG
jgi:ATP-dependent protease Clp ATPase subunit